MAKGKAENNRRETLDPPMSRSLRSRKRGHLVEKMTDDHQNTGEVNTGDTLLQCLEPPIDEGDQHQCHQPLESPPPISDQQRSENNEAETSEITPCEPKRQLVVTLTDGGQENKQNEMENLDKMSNECEPSASSNKHTVNAGIKPDVSEEQMCAEDNPVHEMETNQKVDEVHQMSKEPVVDGPAKKRRRMGMCQLSEKERSQFLVKSTNRVEIDVKHEKCTDMAKEENGPSSKGMSSHQETTEMIQQGDIKPEANQDNKDDREETKVETAGAHRTTMMCEPEKHISEEDGKEGLDTEVTKHRPFEENEPQGKVNLGFNCLENRTEPECQMTVPDAAVTVCDSGPSLCKDSDQTSGIHPSADEELTRTETEEHLTVSVCDAHSSNLDNGDPSLKPHSDAEQLLTRSETEVYDTATLQHVADTVGESQKESKIDQVQEEGPPGPAQNVVLSNGDENKHLNEHMPNNEVEATETEMHKQQVETMSADGHGNFNSGTNHTKGTEMALPLQETESKTTVEKIDQAAGDNPDFSHSSFSDTAAETNCISMGNGHVVNGTREQNGKPDSSTATMGPPQSADFIDLPGLCSLDYVSDSQLNTIVMTEQVVAAESGVCSELYEDGTDLIRGLIRELSALNRTVMATHRELENLRRRGKNSRNAIR